MGSAFNKEVRRSISGSLGRFLAIAIISFLGAGFYTGLRMASPDMLVAGDEFYDATHAYDLSVVSSMGLDDRSIELLSEVEGVGAVMPAFRADVLMQAGEGSCAAAVESLPAAAASSDTSDGVHALSDDDAYLNRPILIEGAWPEGADECVLGIHASDKLDVRIGDKISLQAGAGEGDITDTFALSEFTVTGFVNSPLYISEEQLGTTQLGSGSIEVYGYVLEGAFAHDYPYSVAYLGIPAATDACWGEGSYDEAVSSVRGLVEQRVGDLSEARLQSVKDDLHLQMAGLLQEVSARLDWADDLEPPDVYMLDRSKNPGAASLSSDAEGISQIATFLPFMFFLVAALVSLTSMTRMIDEERTEIGTHKALGYAKTRITSKYLIYGALASGIGSALGIVVLGKLLPWFILTSYAVSYDVPVFPTPLGAVTVGKAFLLSLGVTLGATGAAASATLRETPAALMLPRVPKAGKRIFLERIKPLWTRLSFSRKVTARNLLRYKRRFFMAVVGVAGCTALLMVGFGLRDSIGGIVQNQFRTLISYDAAVQFGDGVSRDVRDAAWSKMESAGISDALVVDGFTMIAEGPEDDLRIEAVVPSDEDALSAFAALRQRVGQQPLDLSGDGVVLTEKAATVLGVDVGDELALYDEDMVGDKTGDAYRFRVGGIAENYLGHRVYIPARVYEGEFGESPSFDLVYVKLPDDVDHQAFSDSLLAEKGVSTVSFVSEEISSYEEMLDVMDKLIVVIVLLSAALAFVVLYNLTNINIAERVREIATLKVLGFTRREVNVYVFREVLVMTLIGALVGCVLGVPLTFYIAEAAETANMMFGRTIQPMSFVWSFVITMAFSVIVAFAMRHKLTRVNMVESLKSVE